MRANRDRLIRRKVAAALAVIAIVLTAFSPASFNYSDDGAFGRSLVLGVVPPHLAIAVKEREKQPSSGVQTTVLADSPAGAPFVIARDFPPSLAFRPLACATRRSDRSRAPPQLLA